jgi:hypothetical protein
MTYFAWANGTEPPTFTGPINPATGKRSQAGSLSAFTNRKARDQFTQQTKGAAVAVTAKQARELMAGLDQRAFSELVGVMTRGDQ